MIFTIPISQTIVDNNTLKAQPGDTIKIASGLRVSLRFQNFKGTVENPIIIQNDGLVEIINTTGAGLSFSNCKHFKILGNGDVRHYYGIRVSAATVGVSFQYLTSDFEAGYIIVFNNKGMAVTCKTDPVFLKPETWRANFTMRNVDLHDFYIHDSGSSGGGGEAFYIGHTFYTGWTDPQGNLLYPHVIENLKVHHNRIENIAWDGIQVSSCAGGAEVYNNYVTNVGMLNNGGHAAGILMGTGTIGKVYNNIIDKTTGNGIQLFGLANLTAENNLILNCAKESIFIDDRATNPEWGFYVYNNTIVNTGEGYPSIRTYAALAKINEIKNNIIVRNTATSDRQYIYLENIPSIPKIVKFDVSNNYTTTDINSVRFENLTDYTFKIDSIHLTKGYDKSKFNPQMRKIIVEKGNYLHGFIAFVPDDFDTLTTKLPLVIHLHGVSEYGPGTSTSLSKVLLNGLPRILNTGLNLPAIFVCPQNGSGWFNEVGIGGRNALGVVDSWWADKHLLYAIKQQSFADKIDWDKVTVTGLSAGGKGAVMAAINYPEIFAAVAPQCMADGYDLSRVDALKNMGIWAFHCADDLTVPVQRTREFIAELNLKGIKNTYTEYPSGGHGGAWDIPFTSTVFIEWLLSQSKAVAPIPVEPVPVPVENPLKTKLMQISSLLQEVINTL